MSEVVGVSMDFFGTFFRTCNDALIKRLTWLDNAYGQVTPQNVRGIVKACIHTGGGEYLSLMPDESLGNYSFWCIKDPIYATVNNKIKGYHAWRARASIVFWFGREVEEVKNHDAITMQIISQFSNRAPGKGGHYEILRIYNTPLEIYNQFNYDDVKAHAFMYPYWGVRFEGDLTIKEQCSNVNER